MNSVTAAQGLPEDAGGSIAAAGPPDVEPTGVPGRRRLALRPFAVLAGDRVTGAALLQSAQELRRTLHPLLVGNQALLRCVDIAPSARALIGQQLRAVSDASRLVDALVHLGELEMRVRSPCDSSFELAGAVTQLLRSQETAAQARSAGVRADVGNAWIRGDRVLLQDVLGLLLGELLRAATNGGVLVESRREDRRMIVDLHVSDGSVARAVESLQSCSARPTADEPVRITIARRIAAWFGCELSLRHASGALVGARIVLRHAVPGVAIGPEATAYSRPHGGLHALVVDDDAAVRLATRLLLEAEGLEVCVACGRDEALACAAVQPPDVVIADWRLGPGESGTDVIAAVRERCARRTPAVLLTGDVQEPAGGAAVRVLAKPFAADELLDAIALASADGG